ncbi:Aste57867_1970 [Aphanomyces stellatus]|uniref:Aste57867_1970 protein n=1 Tax=Aphanomyces stellatus TaxID=120398 RepID=A0A485KA26_9STRA|nr:hypothetical protein As57867_001968 [Aphanomyces stellatus]VFT79175.1 Aste57867_1970 [Aphanomyces stellatus]
MTSSNVLRSSELLSLVWRYQCGLYEDMIPFRTLGGYLKHLRPATFDFSAMTDLRACLRPWLMLHGHTRLHCLCSSATPRTAAVLLYAVYFGDLALVRALFDVIPAFATAGPKKYLPLVEVAAIGGSLPTIHILLGLDYPFMRNLVYEMVLRNNTTPLFNAMVPPCHPTPPLLLALRAAVQDDTLNQLELLLPQCDAYMLSQAIIRAVHYGATQCVCVLLTAGATLEYVDELAYPARMGHLDILELMLDHNGTHTRVDMLSASLTGAVRGHDVDLVRQILDMTVADEAVVQPSHLTFAVESNSFEMIELLWERRHLGQWRDDAASTWATNYPTWVHHATQHGWLERLQCLATKDNHHSLDWTKLVCDAARARQSRIVKWLVESGIAAPDVPTLEQLMVDATGPSQSHLKTSTMEILSFVQTLLPPNYHLPTSFVLNAASNDRPVFQFFWALWWPVQDTETRRSVGQECLQSAAGHGKQKTVKMLVKDFQLDLTESVVDAAKSSRCKNLIVFVLSCNSDRESQRFETSDSREY